MRVLCWTVLRTWALLMIGSGESTGDTMGASYEDFAEDAVAGAPAGGNE